MATSMASQVNLRQPGQTECGGHTVVPDLTQPSSIARPPQPRGRTSCGVTSTTLRPGAMLWPECRAFTSTGERSCAENVRSLVPRLWNRPGIEASRDGEKLKKKHNISCLSAKHQRMQLADYVYCLLHTGIEDGGLLCAK